MLCALLFSTFTLTAADHLSISLGDLDGGAWQAQGVSLQLDLSADQDHFTLSADTINHPLLAEPIQHLHFDCQHGQVADRQIICDKGLLDLTLDSQKQRRIKARINWKIDSQSIDLYLENISFSKGNVALVLKADNGRWQLSVEGRHIDIDRLGRLATPLSDSIRRFALHGGFNLSADLRGRDAHLLSGSTRIDYRDVSFSDQPGDYIGQGLSGQWRGNISHKRDNWFGNQRLQIASGELLTPQFYLSPSNRPLLLESDYRYQAAKAQLYLERFTFKQMEGISAEGQANVSLQDKPQLVSLNLKTAPTDLSQLFRENLLPVLVNPQFEAMELAGKLALNLSVGPGESRASIELKDVYIEQGLQGEENNQRQFALYDLDGQLNWSSGSATDSHLNWQGGHLFGGITLGAAKLDLNLSGRNLALVNQASIPVLDGVLQAERFALEQGDAGPKIQFQGYLTPISMEAISRAVGWPRLAGQLSGMIPGLSYENGVIAVEGIALVKIFDGAIVVRDLKLDDLFGALPALGADLELRDIDLETLTRTFSFGKITGRLEGRVNDLRLENWTPVSFDAAFNTPRDDETRHRINQKAVDNISNLGGSGVSGALSRSFLRIFKEFGYDRLGISCRLEHGVCHMGGIEPAERGYYLVKGGGLPRIDIMGFNQKTDWQVLVSKLKQIASGGAPVIK